MSITDAAACFADRAITLAQLRAIAPHAPDSALDPLNSAMAAFEINTPRRQACFLAQVAFESDQFRVLTEAWGPTAAQLRYEGRKDLGNVVAGDGYRYRGRGAIQLTGRANYTRAAGVLSIDLVGKPELAADTRYAYTLAALYWTWHDLNRLADEGDYEGITRAINGGLNGYQVRLEYYARAARTLGCVPESGG